jgi:hypothetical protein
MRPQQTVFKRHAFAGQEAALRALVAVQPDQTLAELRDALHSTASLSSVWRALDRLQLTRKKTVHAVEQRRPDVMAARRLWRAWLPLRDVAHYVFLDECGVATDLLRRYGRGPRGMRLSTARGFIDQEQIGMHCLRERDRRSLAEIQIVRKSSRRRQTAPDVHPPRSAASSSSLARRLARQRRRAHRRQAGTTTCP